jgi:hypothetical protein
MSTAILNGFEGFYHGLAFSFPFSVPILVCLGRLLLEGFLPGFFAILGTLFGQLCFFFLILNGSGPTRNLVYLWYTVEPFLAFIGFVLCFKLATDFMSGNRNRSISMLNKKTNLFQNELVIFFCSFFLMFLNPSMNSTGSRVVLAAGSLFDQSSITSLPYIFAFVATVFVLVLFLWPLLITLIISKGSITDRFSRFSGLTEGMGVSASAGGYPQPIQFISEARPLVSFLLVGCLMSGGFQYSWRLFTQYPASFIDREGQTAWVREFPSFDSNIQHRDKNLPLDRHLPVDKMNSRRVLSGRPPLSEQQKADASLKFQSFFLNSLEEKIETNLLKYRSKTENGSSSSSDISSFLLMLKSQGRSFSFFDSNLQDLSSRFSPRVLENNTKGKPKYSYIRSYPVNSEKDMGLKEILHDQLQVYSALFAKMS